MKSRPVGLSGSLSRAYRYCEWITIRHYENFPVASWLLPASIRPQVAAIYAFARCADDFADEKRYQGRSLEFLEKWRAALHVVASPSKARTKQSPNDAGNGLPEHPIFLALADTVQRHRLPVQLLDDLLTAFTLDVTKRRYADWEELLQYCRYSANPVGRLVLLLFGIRDPELHERSDRICTALQLANHWQDLRIDLARDMLYVPQTLLREYAVSEEDLKKPQVAHSEKFRRLMKELVRRTRLLFDGGEPLVHRVKGGLKLELKLTVAGGRAILDRIERADYDVFRHRPALSLWDKMGLLSHALFS